MEIDKSSNKYKTFIASSPDIIMMESGFHNGKDFVSMHVRQVLDMKEKAIKDALINLGWTPPENKLTEKPTIPFEKIREKISHFHIRNGLKHSDGSMGEIIITHREFYKLLCELWEEAYNRKDIDPDEVDGD